MHKNILIIYYSWSGNTDAVARMIQKKTGGELFKINPVVAYPSDYNACVKQARKEVNSAFRPEISIIPENMNNYDVVIIGSPVWCNTMAPPLFTLLSNADLKGKSILPFCTHGGGGKGRFVSDILTLCPQSKVLNDLEIYASGNSKTEINVSVWLEENGLIRQES